MAPGVRAGPVQPTLRPAVPDDVLCLSVLGMQVFLDTYATGGIRPSLAREVTQAYSLEAMTRGVCAPGSPVTVAELDGHLIGFSQLALGTGHALAPPGVPAELVRLYVQEPFTGRSVGTALLRRAEEQAARQGATVLWLTPWVHNLRALAFYAHCGYQDHGATLFRFEGEEHENRVLARRLTAPPAR